MTHARHLKQMAARERQELLSEEAKARARREADAVAQGVVETVVLGDARGEDFLIPGDDRGRARPIRRLTGLQWLDGKGLLTADQLRMGERYGEAWRAVQIEVSLRSCLHVVEGQGGVIGPPALSQVEWRANMADRLDRLRTTLRQRRLIEVCDQICGQELTPRQAGQNGRDSAVAVELVRVALDLLTEREGTQ